MEQPRTVLNSLLTSNGVINYLTPAIEYEIQPTLIPINLAAKAARMIYEDSYKLNGWKMMRPHCDPHEDPFRMVVLEKSNEVQRETLIIFRGTENTYNWWFNLMVIGVKHGQQEFSKLMEKWEKRVEKILSTRTKVCFIGHSLGGWFAQLFSKLHSAHSITFNAPALGDYTHLNIRSIGNQNNCYNINIRLEYDVVSLTNWDGVQNFHGDLVTLRDEFSFIGSFCVFSNVFWIFFPSKLVELHSIQRIENQLNKANAEYKNDRLSLLNKVTAPKLMGYVDMVMIAGFYLLIIRQSTRVLPTNLPLYISIQVLIIRFLVSRFYPNLILVFLLVIGTFFDIPFEMIPVRHLHNQLGVTIAFTASYLVVNLYHLIYDGRQNLKRGE